MIDKIRKLWKGTVEDKNIAMILLSQLDLKKVCQIDSNNLLLEFKIENTDFERMSKYAISEKFIIFPSHYGCLRVERWGTSIYNAFKNNYG